MPLRQLKQKKQRNNIMAEVKAKLGRLRIAPRKVRLITELIKGMDYEKALELLDKTPKRSARHIMRLLDSAAANGYNNLDLVKENLYVKEITVDEGMKLKRAKAKGFGMVMWIERKSSHINLVLDERVPGMKAEKKKEEVKKVEEVKVEEKKEETKPEVQKEMGRKGLLGGLKRKMFRRKAI